jgi:murein endopeptidase
MYVSIPDTAVAAVGTYHVLVVCAVWHPQVHNTTSVQPLCALSENRARPQIFVHTAAKRTLCAPQSTRSLSTITMCIFGDNTHLFVAHRAQIGSQEGGRSPGHFPLFHARERLTAGSRVS